MSDPNSIETLLVVAAIVWATAGAYWLTKLIRGHRG